MQCGKCRGLLVATQFSDLVSGESCYMARCLSCGMVTDETMILNRYSRPTTLALKKKCKARENPVRM